MHLQTALLYTQNKETTTYRRQKKYLTSQTNETNVIAIEEKPK